MTKNTTSELRSKIRDVLVEDIGMWDVRSEVQAAHLTQTVNRILAIQKSQLLTQIEEGLPKHVQPENVPKRLIPAPGRTDNWVEIQKFEEGYNQALTEVKALLGASHDSKEE